MQTTRETIVNGCVHSWSTNFNGECWQVVSAKPVKVGERSAVIVDGLPTKAAAEKAGEDHFKRAAALDELKRAVEFIDSCKADNRSSETGAMRDAREWLEVSARKVVATI